MRNTIDDILKQIEKLEKQGILNPAYRISNINNLGKKKSKRSVAA